MRLNSNIKGFPLYHVTKDGKVYNIRRNREVTIHPHYRTGRNIVHLYSNGKRYNLKVYRLVAEAYIPNPENKPCVCHKDNNKSNDRVENLYWGTYKENSQQMVSDMVEVQKVNTVLVSNNSNASGILVQYSLKLDIRLY